MRNRLLLVLVAISISIVALYGIPRVFVVADLVRDSERDKAEASAHLVAVVLGEYESRSIVTSADLHVLVTDSIERIVYTAPNGTVTSSGPALDATADDVTISKAVPGGGSLTFTRSGVPIAKAVREALTPLVSIGLGLVLLSVVIGLILARRLSAPFVQLATASREFGEGRLDIPVENYTIPEAQAIAHALHESGQALKERIRREHEFAANASHQLRTPITALRLELEDLSLWTSTPAPVAEQLGRALAEIDRLTEAIQQLLEHARGQVPGASTRVPVDSLLTDAAKRWQPQASAADRIIKADTAPCPRDRPGVRAPAPASQILDVLVHNALRHGQGTIRLTATAERGYLKITVADEGPRPLRNNIFDRKYRPRPSKNGPSAAGSSTTHGEGIGLSLASELAEALNGHLVLGTGPTTAFTLMLPA